QPLRLRRRLGRTRRERLRFRSRSRRRTRRSDAPDFVRWIARSSHGRPVPAAHFPVFAPAVGARGGTPLSSPKLAPLSLAIDYTRVASWLQITSQLDPQYGGIASSLPFLAAATEDEWRYRAPIVGLCDEARDVRAGTQVMPASRLRWTFDLTLRNRL